MKKFAALLAPLVFVLSIGAAQAAEKKGEVTAIDTESRTLSLSNWHFSYPEDVTLDGIEVGDRVKVYFKIKGGDTYIVKRVRELD